MKFNEIRELAESQLAEAWCASGSAPLYIDGSITASAIAASSPLAVGVIKSHRRLMLRALRSRF